MDFDRFCFCSDSPGDARIDADDEVVASLRAADVEMEQIVGVALDPLGRGDRVVVD